ncbi:MAG: AIR synthase family protein [Peptococcaceae bacterium]|nr:AIR synthase family protein [Peptococcaceae bacterium]
MSNNECRTAEAEQQAPNCEPQKTNTEKDGKLPPALLEDLLKWSGAPRAEVLNGPGIGEDAALIRWPEGAYLVAASDPIVGAQKGAGHLLVAVNANDIACKGGDPRYFLVTLIVPHEGGLERAHALMAEIDESCRRIGVSIVGGHTELTTRYTQPVIVGTMLGSSRYCYDATQARAGDVVLMTKHAGLEGMSIVAGDRPDLFSFLTGQELEDVKEWESCLSVIPEAALIRDLVIAMHDPTEGGLAGGLDELSHACGRSIQIDKEQILISPLTRKAAQELGFDPMRLISSGVLLAVLPQRYKEEALRRLKKAGIPAAIIGEIEKSREKFSSTEVAAEELWRLLTM